jgi:thiol-disulfide isomerase/thioredoxin
MRLALALVLIAAVGPVNFGNSEALAMSSTAAPPAPKGTLPGLDGASEWINSPPLTGAALRGKVVLIDFWTYSCINWRRTLPYLRAWATKYKDQGLVVIGVHTPEFGFERISENVHRATKTLELPYPVAVDSGYKIWRAFDNQYWPALYLADAKGQIRHHQFGEGGYEQTERAIQRLLEEAGAASVPHQVVSIDPQGVEAAADFGTLGSPETYVGYARAQYFSSPGDAIPDRSHDYTAPVRLGRNEWALTGNWTIGAEAAVLNGSTGRIAYRFHARDLNLILAPPEKGTPVKFRVRIDGAPPGAVHGSDVDDQGNGTVSEPRMYQLIRQRGSIADRVFDIEFLSPGVEAYDFTFG